MGRLPYPMFPAPQSGLRAARQHVLCAGKLCPVDSARRGSRSRAAADLQVNFNATIHCQDRTPRETRGVHAFRGEDLGPVRWAGMNEDRRSRSTYFDSSATQASDPMARALGCPHFAVECRPPRDPQSSARRPWTQQDPASRHALPSTNSTCFAKTGFINHLIASPPRMTHIDKTARYFQDDLLSG
jgi:hypothetical protein